MRLSGCSGTRGQCFHAVKRTARDVKMHCPVAPGSSSAGEIYSLGVGKSPEQSAWSFLPPLIICFEDVLAPPPPQFPYLISEEITEGPWGKWIEKLKLWFSK